MQPGQPVMRVPLRVGLSLAPRHPLGTALQTLAPRTCLPSRECRLMEVGSPLDGEEHDLYIGAGPRAAVLKRCTSCLLGRYAGNDGVCPRLWLAPGASVASGAKKEANGRQLPERGTVTWGEAVL